MSLPYKSTKWMKIKFWILSLIHLHDDYWFVMDIPLEYLFTTNIIIFYNILLCRILLKNVNLLLPSLTQKWLTNAKKWNERDMQWHTIHSMNRRYTLGKLNIRKNELEGEVDDLLFSSQLWNASTKKRALTMEMPWTLWPIWILQDLLVPLISLNIPIV